MQAPTTSCVRRHAVLVSALTALLMAGCPGRAQPPVDGAVDSAPTDAPTSVDATADAAPVNNPADCDPIGGGAECALPWPSNLYLVPDTTRATGFALQFGPTSLPINVRNVHFDPAPYARMDGYGLGVPIIVMLPRVDISAMATEDHIERSLADDAQVLLFAVHGTAVTRVPYFVELDSTEPDPTQQVLFVRPAVILDEATRYLVAFRGVHDTTGAAIAPTAAFARLRDGTAATDPLLAPRQARFEQVFTLLTAAGIDRSSLVLAWDFVTASDAALHGRLLHMRDDALATTGAQGPAIQITRVTPYARTMDGSGHAVDPDIAYEFYGTMTVPHYMKPRARGWEFNLGADGLPAQNGTRAAEFWVRVPWSALDGAPSGIVDYGHGLFGQGDQVTYDYVGRVANANHLIFFAADLVGMSTEDSLLVSDMTRDLSNFVWIADRLHQGVLEYVLLARAIRERFTSLPEVAPLGLHVDPTRVYYDGSSQGGIFAGTVIATSPDIVRGRGDVPGNNYATLLYRSHDFDPIFTQLRENYARTANRALALASMQLLWDGTDPVSYYSHVATAPFAGNAPHGLLLTAARGDNQVAVVTDEVAARGPGSGIAMMAHYDADRTPVGITQQAYPYTGSGFVLYHFGNAWPAPGNHPPTDPAPDPHEFIRRTDAANTQLIHFLATGEIEDVCGGMPCVFPRP